MSRADDVRAMVNAGFNAWLASLPADDWGDSFENAVPIYWDEEFGAWVEGERPLTASVQPSQVQRSPV